MKGSWFIYELVMFHMCMSHAHTPCVMFHTCMSHAHTTCLMRSIWMYVYLDESMSCVMLCGPWVMLFGPWVMLRESWVIWLTSHNISHEILWGFCHEIFSNHEILWGFCHEIFSNLYSSIFYFLFFYPRFFFQLSLNISCILMMSTRM